MVNAQIELPGFREAFFSDTIRAWKKKGCKAKVGRRILASRFDPSNPLATPDEYYLMRVAKSEITTYFEVELTRAEAEALIEKGVPYYEASLAMDIDISGN